VKKSRVRLINFYTKGMSCAICETRRPRRFCPGVRGDICSVCCGTEREVTVDCPFDCEFLREARRHEKPESDPALAPNQDIRLTEKFLEDHQPLLMFVGRSLANAALSTSGTVDFDVREALDSLVRTYRTLQSGVYYESLPPNPLAARVHQTVQGDLAEYRRREVQQLGMSRTRDADVLGILAFLQRVEFDQNNGRRRGRAFIDALSTYSREPEPAAPPESPLILP
jgi:hypothetical protein